MTIHADYNSVSVPLLLRFNNTHSIPSPCILSSSSSPHTQNNQIYLSELYAVSNPYIKKHLKVNIVF